MTEPKENKESELSVEDLNSILNSFQNESPCTMELKEEDLTT